MLDSILIFAIINSLLFGVFIIVVRSFFWGILNVLELLDRSLCLQRELTHKILEETIKREKMRGYAEYLINDMMEFRKVSFRDNALAVRFDEIVSRWETYKEERDENNTKKI